MFKPIKTSRTKIKVVCTRYKNEQPTEILTSQEQTGEGDYMKLLDRDVIAVHEEIQQINCKVSGVWA